MKRILTVCLLVLFLTGCGKGNDSIDNLVTLRNHLLKGNGCKFSSAVTADYGDSTYTFAMDCTVDKTGDMLVTVTAPETISGISARISKGTGKLVFDDKSLVFSLIADGQITPVCGPWLFIESLIGGYVTASGEAAQGARTQINDSFSGAEYIMDIWTEKNNLPDKAELIWEGKRILSMDIDDFVIL